MTQEDFQVVAELYQLLAKFAPEKIAAASRKTSVSPNIRNALDALYREARSKDEQIGDELQPDGPQMDRKSSRRTGAVERSRERSLALEKGNATGASLAADAVIHDALMTFLLDETRFPSKLALAEFCDRLGIDCEIDSRDSRERAARKIIRAAAHSTRQTLKQLLEVAEIPARNQTEGWLDLIMGNR